VTSLDALAAALTSSPLITDPDVMEAYRRDEAHLVPAGQPAAVLRARSTADVGRVLAWAEQTGTAVVPRGAGTGLAGGAAASGGRRRRPGRPPFDQAGARSAGHPQPR
jgi:glycolate oxidase